MTRKAAVIDAAAMKVHVAGGVVWCAMKTESPKRLDVSVDDFIKSTAFARTDKIRVVGMRQNATLIAKLFEQKTHGLLESVELVSPLVCPTQRERQQPEAVLYYMRRFVRSPSLGGFHEATSHDFVSYALARELDGNAAPGVISRLLAAHPAWPALSFLPDLDQIHCAELLSEILDPRWYVDPCNPDRLGKLEAWLGLCPKTQYGVSHGQGRPWRRHRQCQRTLRCWQDPQRVAEALATFEHYGGTTAVPAAEFGMRPQDFVWRTWGRRRDNPVIADLRGSQVFVSFVRHVWLSELYQQSDSVVNSMPLFRPRDFFLHVVEAEAYDHHITYLRAR